MLPRFPALVPALLIAVAFAAACRAADDPLAQARAALKQGDADKALAFADKAVAAEPANPDAHLTRGLIHAALRRPKDAVADFDKVLELDPKRSEVFDLRGSEQFKRGLFAESVADFDRFLKDHPDEAPGHWRRGISLYYAGKYDEGRKQFGAYEKVDTNDVENAVWHFLCKARADGVEKARAAMLKIGKDKRVPMMQVYDLFHGDLKPDDVLAAAEAGDATAEQRRESLFYAHLYLGLYFDATGDKKKALEHLTPAAHKYGVNGYMGEVARVHEELLLKEKKD
jgi:lipoprotein NlpI